MSELEFCIGETQHFWLPLARTSGLQSYSCPSCGALVYWSEATLSWVKPLTSGGQTIPGNNERK